ncbi:MAG: HAD-IA family hydrolase [Treponema sp.]|jgi:putative hydrolase of the HAD superfamily|nr:HAD-IA family hydrolase [Treponema sp.]
MIKYLLFDLDNTLYSIRCGLEENVSKRIRTFLAAWMGMGEEEAMAERRKGVVNYGTTLEWLMEEKNFTDVEGYYRFVHPEGEVDSLRPDPELREFLSGLPYPKAILTNSNREHVDRVLVRLELGDIFTHIFDMRWNNLKGKPHPDVFRRVLGVLEKSPEEVLFIDDYPKYVTGFNVLGGAGVLLDELDSYPDFPGRRIRNIREIVKFL